MNWIKRSYEQAVLLVLSIALLAVSGFLILRSRTFEEQFQAIHRPVVKSTKVPAVETARLDVVNRMLAEPPKWKDHRAQLMVSRKYIIREDKPYDPTEGADKLHPPVPNDWFFANKLDILNTGVLDADPDNDGFSNLDEWTGNDPSKPASASTDPNNPDSHPPYLTKLKLKEFIQVPFRLVLKSYDAGVFQINTLDVRQPSQFLEMGAEIAGTKYRISGPYVEKKIVDENEIERDISELTIEHTETGEKLVLVMGKIADSPDSFALFRFSWRAPIEFRVKKDQVFALPPERDVQYKLIDINSNQATIDNLKTGEKGIKISRQ
jgi:hypothetical protein